MNLLTFEFLKAITCVKRYLSCVVLKSMFNPEVSIKSVNISLFSSPLNSGAYKSALESINTGIPLYSK
ncbi:hypothetical protein D3C72_1539690 [compost metagenome]